MRGERTHHPIKKKYRPFPAADDVGDKEYHVPTPTIIAMQIWKTIGLYR